MLKTILFIRASQFVRIIKEIGFVRTLLLAPFVLFFLINSLINISGTVHSEVYLIIITLTLINIHFVRNDKIFLSIVNVNRFKFCFTEYLIINLPFIISFLISKKWYYAAVLPAVIALLSLLKFTLTLQGIVKSMSFLLTLSSVSFSFRNKLHIPFLPSTAFEWISGIRKNLVIIMLIYIPACALSYYTFIVPVAVVLLSILVSVFYLHAEPHEMLEVYQLPASKFLLLKLKKHFIYFFVFALPLFVLFLIFNYEYWYALVIALVIGLSTQVFSILAKYAAYVPNEHLGQNMVYIWLAVVCYFFTFMAPIPIIMIIRNYGKGISNLNFYLNAYNK